MTHMLTDTFFCSKFCIETRIIEIPLSFSICVHLLAFLALESPEYDSQGGSGVIYQLWGWGSGGES